MPQLTSSASAVRPLPPGAYDLSRAVDLHTVATERSFHDEVIIFESDVTMCGWAYNFVLQLRGRGY